MDRRNRLGLLVASLAVGLLSGVVAGWPGPQQVAHGAGEAASLPDKPLWAIEAPAPPAGELLTAAGIAPGPDGGYFVADGQGARLQHVAADGRVTEAWGEPGTGFEQFSFDQNHVAMAVDHTGALVVHTGQGRIERYGADGARLGGWVSDLIVADLALAADDSLFLVGRVFEAGIWRNLVAHHGADGAPLARWGASGSGPGQLQQPGGIAVAPDGTLFVADTGNQRIQHFDSGGQLLGSWGSQGSQPGQLNQPTALTILPDGDVLVDDRLNARIQRFSPSGEPRGLWGRTGAGPGEFNLPGALALAPDGSVWVADTYNARIQRFTSDGVPLGTWGQAPAVDDILGFPSGLATAADGTLYALDVRYDRVRRFGPRGEARGGWGTTGVEPGQFRFAQRSVGLAVTADGTVYVADPGNQRVQAFAPDGTFLRAFAGDGDGDGKDKEPALLVAAPDGTLVAATYSHIERYSSTGQFLGGWGGLGSGKGVFNNSAVAGLAVAGDGTIFATDRGNTVPTGRLQHFDATGKWLDELPHNLDDICALPAPGGPIVAAPDGSIYAAGTGLQQLAADGRRLAVWSPSPGGIAGFLRPDGMTLAGDHLAVSDRQAGRIQVFGRQDPATWRVRIFDNPWLAGWPVVITETERASLAPGEGPPVPEVDPAAWSAELTQTREWPAGEQKFTLRAAGGVRLWLDGTLLVDRWRQAETDDSVRVRLAAGAHRLKLTFRRGASPAALALTVEALDTVAPTAPPPTVVTPLPVTPTWTPTPVLTPWATPLPYRLYLPRLAVPEGAGPAPSPVPASDAGWAAIDGIDVERYDVTLTVAALASGDINARAEVRVKLLAPADHVDLYVEPMALKVDAVREADAPRTYTLVAGTGNSHGISGTRLRSWLGRVVPAGEVVTLSIDYHLDRASFGGMRGMTFNPDFSGSPVFVTRSLPYYARYWIPSHDHPSDAAEVSFELHVPDGAIATASGLLVEGDYNTGSGLDAAGLRVFRWRQRSPTAPYLFIVAFGDLAVNAEELCYDILDETRVVRAPCETAGHRLPWLVYYPAKDSSGPGEVEAARSLQDAVLHFAGKLGPFPFEKVGFLRAPHPYAAEYASLLVFPRGIFRDGLHESIHSWWGDRVRVASWGDFWIKESLTTYAVNDYNEQTSGASTQTLTPCQVTAVNRPPDSDPLHLFIRDDPVYGYDGAPYTKGAATFYDLRLHIAESLATNRYDPRAVAAMEDLLRRLYRRFEGEALSTPALLAFVRANLGAVLRDHGASPAPGAPEALADAWAARWFDLSIYEPR